MNMLIVNMTYGIMQALINLCGYHNHEFDPKEFDSDAIPPEWDDILTPWFSDKAKEM